MQKRGRAKSSCAAAGCSNIQLGDYVMSTGTCLALIGQRRSSGPREVLRVAFPKENTGVSEVGELTQRICSRGAPVELHK